MDDNRKTWVAVALVLTALTVTYVFYRVELAHHREVEDLDAAALLLEEAEVVADAKPEAVTLHLFQSASLDPGALDEQSIEESLTLPADPETRIERIAAAVLRRFDDVLPPRASVRKAYLLEDGTAVVDFSREIGQQLMGGIATELALLQSVARTLTQNQTGVKQVRFLVDGQQRPTLSGHVSIQAPFL